MVSDETVPQLDRIEITEDMISRAVAAHMMYDYSYPVKPEDLKRWVMTNGSMRGRMFCALDAALNGYEYESWLK